MAKKRGLRGSSRSVSGPPQSDPEQKPFTPETLDRTIVAIPLLDRMKAAAPGEVLNIIIDVNLDFTKGRSAARKLIWEWVDFLPGVTPTSGQGANQPPVDRSPSQSWQGINSSKSAYSHQYLFGRLTAENIRELVKINEKAKGDEGRTASALYRIWLDHEVKRFVNVSISTVKADAARKAFGTSGKDIVWAVLDTGIDRTHPHFAKYKNLDLALPLRHRDFTAPASDDAGLERTACIDVAGHGTHVAGIIAGHYESGNNKTIVAHVRRRTETGDVETDTIKDIPEISGIAPQCKLLSLKVLDDAGGGLASNLIAALEYVQALNGDGRRVLIHGINMSVGYDFEPNWFACGQSPLCVEVDRLVRSGVVVVVAAGNTGYGYNQSLARGPVPAGQDVTINDPGNAELAITVGSTHREMPHAYGVSYFSSKGPTGDGRLKPDIVAPGEKIISCQSGNAAASGEVPSSGPAPAAAADNTPTGQVALYKEDSGTSMAAPHVSGAIAAFLSIRREFIGRPEAVKHTFMTTATDLKRAVYFQGKGLVDLMRAIQSV